MANKYGDELRNQHQTFLFRNEFEMEIRGKDTKNWY